MEQRAGHEARPCHGLTSPRGAQALKATPSGLFSGLSGSGRKKKKWINCFLDLETWENFIIIMFKAIHLETDK